MSIRTRTSPGIEIKEIDRSAYTSTVDNAIVDTRVLITGFAHKGEDYTVNRITSLQAFTEYYGIPETDAEKFLYAGVKEILNRGGVALVAKLPYSNDAKDHFPYVDYAIMGKIEDGTDPMISGMKAVDSNLTSYIKIDRTDSRQDEIIRDGLTELGVSCKVTDLVNRLTKLINKLNLSSSINSTFNSLDDIKGSVEDLAEYIGGMTETDIQTLNDIRTTLNSIIEFVVTNNYSLNSQLLSMAQLDSYKVGSRSGLQNKIRIVDITKNKYKIANIKRKVTTTANEQESTHWESTNVECVGIMPILVSPVQAMYYQGIIPHHQTLNLDTANYYEYTDNISAYTVINDFQQFGCISGNSFDLINYNIPLSSNNFNEQTVSKQVAETFPTINFSSVNTVHDQYIKQIGVVVLQAYLDQINNKIKFSVVESFVGSLDRSAKDVNGRSIFIDDVINDASQYINVFSNVNTASDEYQTASTIAVMPTVGMSLGFNSLQSEKQISYSESIITPITTILAKSKNPLSLPLDLIVDAGVSNIAQLCQINGGNIVNIDWTRPVNQTSLANQAWRTVITKFDDFCRYTRKDCMFIADGLRQFCLNGNEKLVRRTSPTTTVENTIVPKITYMTGINSSYTAGYCNWFQVPDDMSGGYMWIPPSIKAAGIYVYCDAYCSTWSAPAGINRGTVPGTVDCAFNPDGDEAGKIYSNCWNYAVNYPYEGITMEGQKTMQLQRTAFDRVNVRRLFLYLEKAVRTKARYFVYERNNEKTRQRFVDSIQPIFEEVKSNYGIAEYLIKCDAEINTAEVVDNNEMRCIISIRPIKTLEWIVCDFICTNQTVNITETIYDL